MILRLPYPPSLNRLYRSIGRGRVLLSADARSFYDDVRSLIARQGHTPFRSDQRLRVSILATQKDRRRRDLDNIAKATLDALTKAGLWPDDSQIDSLKIDREFSSAPAILVQIEVIE